MDPIFDLSTPEKVVKYTKNTETEISGVIRNVKERNRNSYMSSRTPAFITEWIAEPIYNSKVRRTMNFRVEDTCIGCGLCARKCPVQAIEMQDKRPVWVKDKCGLFASLSEVCHSVWQKHQETWTIHEPEC